MPTTHPITLPTARSTDPSVHRPASSERLARVIALPTRTLHPAGSARHTEVDPAADGTPTGDPSVGCQEGSLLTEYGLLALVGAAVAGVLIRWANGGAITGFFDGLLTSARGMVGS